MGILATIAYLYKSVELIKNSKEAFGIVGQTVEGGLKLAQKANKAVDRVCQEYDQWDARWEARLKAMEAATPYECYCIKLEVMEDYCKELTGTSGLGLWLLTELEMGENPTIQDIFLQSGRQEAANAREEAAKKQAKKAALPAAEPVKQVEQKVEEPKAKQAEPAKQQSLPLDDDDAPRVYSSDD